MQQILSNRAVQKRKLDAEQLVYFAGDVMRIKTSDGCPNGCPFCYEPTSRVFWELPEITENKVQVLDMNFLARKDILAFLESFPEKFDGRKIKYEAVCGFDYRLMNYWIAETLKKKEFYNAEDRMGWLIF